VLALICAVWQGVLRHIAQRLACYWKVALLLPFRAPLLLLLDCKLCCSARCTALLMLLCVAAAQLLFVLCRQSRAPVLLVLSVLLCAQLAGAGWLRRPSTCSAAFRCCSV
jgi:hypothetical protein